MASIDVVFCRALLAEAVADLKLHHPGIRSKKDAWVWHAGRDHWEFHGPNNFHWHGSASNAYEARYKGWCDWMRRQGTKGYE